MAPPSPLRASAGARRADAAVQDARSPHTKHQPPKACGIGEWDYTGGFSGSGGGADIRKVHPGKNGAVKILRPGFYFEDSSLLRALG